MISCPSARTLPLLTLCLFFSPALLGWAWTWDSPPIEVPVRQVYFPETGYGEGDEIQLVAQGELPDPCYELGEQVLSRDPSGAFVLHQYAWRHSTESCDTGDLLGTFPFSVPSSLGRLRAGNYQVRFEPDDGKAAFRPLHIELPASPGSSPELAWVTDVEIRGVVLEGQSIRATIRGTLPTPCSRLSEAPSVKLAGDTILLTPAVSGSLPCAGSAPSFEREVDLGVLPPGVHLLHVRSQGGGAIERIFQVIRTQKSSTSSRGAPLSERT